MDFSVPSHLLIASHTSPLAAPSGTQQALSLQLLLPVESCGAFYVPHSAIAMHYSQPGDLPAQIPTAAGSIRVMYRGVAEQKHQVLMNNSIDVATQLHESCVFWRCIKHWIEQIVESHHHQGSISSSLATGWQA